jgi:hypothetical protein
MAFDRTTQADLDALKAEVVNDPAALGYDMQSTKIILDKLNSPAANPGGQTVSIPLTVGLLVENLDPGEYASLTQGERDYVSIFLMRNVSENLDAVKTKLATLFPANGPTRGNIGQLRRAASRAEVLFGEGTQINRDDWIAARDKGAA